MTTDRRTVYLVPCSADKVDRLALAGELYTGQFHRYAATNARRAVEIDPDALGWAIVSALHGIILPTRPIAPYDAKLRGLTHPTTLHLIRMMRRQLSELADDLDPELDLELVAWLPNRYADAVAAAAEGTRWKVDQRFAGAAGIGAQRYRLRRDVADLESDAGTEGEAGS